jgi:hypothetical protein
MQLKRASREVARVVSQYTAALIHESNGNPAKTLSTLYELLVARLRYNVGPRYYSLFELADCPRAVWDNFITDDPWFKNLLEQMSSQDARLIADDKALFYQHCTKHGLATIPLLCLVSAHTVPQYANVPCATNVAEWRAALANAPDELFIKPVDGTFGEGAFTTCRTEDRVRFAGRDGTLDDLFGHLKAMLVHERGWLVQPLLRCHPAIAQIMGAHGMGTVRAVTCMVRGQPRLLLGVLKITVGDNVTDNFHHGSTGNLVAPIDLDSGVVGAARGSTRRDWPAMAAFSRHPETGHSIEGFIVPGWSEVVALALRSQQSLPSLNSTGWDIAVTADGPLVIETNARYSVDILQVAHQRGLKRDLLRELGTCWKQ